jgi:hypothetical protein
LSKRKAAAHREALALAHSPRASRALAGGDLLAARVAAGDPPHVDLDEAAALLALIAREDSEKLDAAAVRFLGRACLERSFIALGDAQLLVAAWRSSGG